MLKTILLSKVSFFDSNPVGRILNRFSKDISIGDLVLPLIAAWFLENAIRVLSIIIIICVLVPWAIILVAIVLTIGIIIRSKVVPVLKEAMKLNLMSRSPIASILGATMSGLPTLRAYNKVQHF